MLDVYLIMKCYISHRKSKHYFNNCKIFFMKNSVFVYKKLNFTGKMSVCKPCFVKI